MKRRNLFILSFLIPLLFTSCLANLLNEKFGYSVPVIIDYDTMHDTIPKRKKIPAGKPLTKEELPDLAEPGYDFAGWFSDENHTIKIEVGAVLSENTTLHALWIPRTDTPFTIYNYFLNPRENSSNPQFVQKSQYTQNETGTTDHEVMDEYDIHNTSLELENYYRCNDFSNGTEERRIKGDGSTIIHNYYYLYKIYNNEFSTIFSLLPNDQDFPFLFIEQTPGSTFPFVSITSTLDTYCRATGSYYNDYLGKTITTYNKFVTLNFGSLSFTEIPANTFYNQKTIVEITLPPYCTQIEQGAFYGCDNLMAINTLNSDSARTWHCSDGTNLGTSPNSMSLANLLKSNQYISLSFE